MKKELGIFSILVVLCIVLSILNPRFLSPTNIQNMARLVGMFGIFSIGIGIVIITGGIDLSAGSIFSLLGILLCFMLVQLQLPWQLVVAAIILIGTSLGMIHGFLVTRLKIQPFIVTLCGLLVYRSLARFIANDSTKGFGYSEGFETLNRLATGNFLAIPMPFVLLIIIATAAWVALHRSVYGRYLFAVGCNEEAARFSGINTNKIIASAYVISALLAAVSGILFAFYSNAIAPSSHGSFYELYGIAAAVIGGCSLRGGEGSVLGIVIGAALLQVLQNLVNLLGIPSSLNFAVMGMVILIGVIADRIAKQRSEKKSLRAPNS